MSEKYPNKTQKMIGKTTSPDMWGAFGIGMGLMGHEPAAPAMIKRLKRGGPAELRSRLCIAHRRSRSDGLPA